MSLLDAFYHRCERAPNRTALVDGPRRLGYRELAEQVERLSASLDNNVKPCARVAILLDRGIDAVIGIFAALRNGACYIPLDSKNPPERLSFIIDDAAADCVIGRGPRPQGLRTAAAWLDIDQLAEPDAIPEPAVIDPERLAAILYTSGSTGTPKGVALSHRAMRNFADWAIGTFNIVAGDRIASLAPFHFDLSVFDLFAGLRAGASLHFVPSMLTLSPSRLVDWLRDEDIGVFYTVPSLLGFIAMKGALPDKTLPQLKTILFAGEVFPTARLAQLCESLPGVDFYNLYGPTETNVCCYWPVDRARLRDGRPIPIGWPACGAELRIDEESGELLARGPNNLSGYWRQGHLHPALTTDDFYPTGDQVSLNERGEYCYHGRLDRMMKCSGYRVEPAEIEATFLSCSGVSACAVVGIADSASGQRPAAALVLLPDADFGDIVRSAKAKLPAYMHPCKCTVVEQLPLLDNGKTDYRTLQKRLEDA
ncbi:MAG: D-alanine--poly(phosphoribitol) ligase [Methylomicrobium sp.]